MSTTKSNDKPKRRELVAPGVYRSISGKFEIQYIDTEGRLRFKTLPAKTNITQAKAERERMRTKVADGEAVAPSRIKFGDVAQEFLTTFEGLVLAGEKSARTLELYKQRHRSHIAPTLDRLPIQKVQAADVARLLDSLRRKGLSPWTVQGVYILVGSIFSHAMTRGLIVESPLKRISKAERPRGKAQTKVRVLTDTECGELVMNAPGVWSDMIATAADTGLRLSELLGLRWQDVNLTARTIHARYQLSVAKGDTPAKLVGLKSDAGEREIDHLSAELVMRLRMHKADRFAFGHAGATDYVFGTRDGKPLSQRNAGRAIKSAGDAAKLNPEGAEPVGWHDVRHSAISRWIALGLDVVQVQRRAGHARPSITLDTYSHEFEKANRSTDLRDKLAASGIGAAIGSSTDD